MVDGQNQEPCSHATHRHGPGLGHIAVVNFQVAGHHQRDTLPHNVGHTIERTANADKQTLPVRIKRQHIEAVGSNVVGSTTESHQPEEGQRQLHGIRRLNGEGHAG